MLKSQVNSVTTRPPSSPAAEVRRSSNNFAPHGHTMVRNNWILQCVNASRPGTPKDKSLHSSSFFSSSNSSLGSHSSSPGRDLLDLPLEIRLLIYEAVFPPASVALQSGKNPGMIVKLQNYPDLISRGSRDVQLFRTCRAIYEEAAPIFYSSLHVLVYQHLSLLRFDFLPRIGAYNASFIKRAIITPIGLPGEHHRFLECLGVKHGGLVGLENLTLELWNLDHVSAFVNTCQELMHHHGKLKILFGRGIDSEGQLHPGDIPARLKLAKRGQLPACRVSSYFL